MFGSRLFRETAIIHNAQPEPLDEPLRVTAPHEWAMLAGLGIALLGVAAWAAFGSVERSFSGEGALVRAGERHAISSPVSGNVVDVLAQPGDRVEAGQAIARVKLPELDWRVQVARARIALLEEQAEHSAASAADRTLANARAELIELVAPKSAGHAIVSPYDGILAVQNLVAGQMVTTGVPVAEVRLPSIGRPIEVLMFVPPGRLTEIEPGMEARVAVAVPDRIGVQVLPAEIVEISPHPMDRPPWLSRFGLAPTSEWSPRGHLVRLALRERTDLRFEDGIPCRVDIVLGRHAPFTLLGSSFAS